MTDKPKPEPKPEPKTPEAWAESLGPKQMAAFASADYLHGWSEHAYHYQGEPLLMTQECFESALKAAGEFPTVAPHKAALGKLAAERFNSFKPLQKKQDPKPEAKKEGS